MNKTQRIKKSDLRQIYNSISDNCSWKKKIQDAILWSEDKYIEADEALINKGFEEGNADQKKLIEKYFKISEPKDICKQIEDWDSILEINGIEDFKDLILKPKTKEERSINALNRMFLITKAYNGVDFEFDWNNTSQYKWRPYKYLSGGAWGVDFVYLYSSCSFPSGAHIKEEKLCKDAYNKFKKVYDDFLMI